MNLTGEISKMHKNGASTTRNARKDVLLVQLMDLVCEGLVSIVLFGSIF